ncbi:hypothetical protein IWY39_004309 [Sphingobium sp. JAI105]|nr:hypothetical protein [Sphingobium sp. JAI105]
MMDPIIDWITHLFVGGLLILAGVHKLSDLRRFGDALRGYQLLPETSIAIVTIVVPAIEITTGMVTFLAMSRAGAAGLVAGVGIFCMYAALILLSLARGIRFIDCGCFAYGAQPPRLNAGMAARNLCIAGFGTLGLLPASSRTTGWLDVAAILAAIATLVLLYAIFEFILLLPKRDLIR